MKALSNGVGGLVAALALSACGGEPPMPAVEQKLGVTGPAFYVDGELYRTVGTPTALPASAPPSSFDTIYDLGGAQAYNVADAAPGNPGYNGGRWMVHAVSFEDYEMAVAIHDANASGDLDSDEEIEAAIAADDATDLGVVRRFVCPAIKLPRRG
jgi:hypothetical protein